MNFCSQCGQPVTQSIPEGDNRLRYVCKNCQTIHYQNPKIVAGAIPVYEHKILLCRRAIEPRKGFWTLPAGFMENQETTEEAAIRETREEAEAEIQIEGLYALIDVPNIDQVHLFYRAILIDGRFGVGAESLESRLFAEDEIPWDEISFPTVFRTLKHYFEDKKSDTYSVHVSSIKREQRLKHD